MKGSFFILCVFLLAFLFCTHKQTNAQQNLVFNGDFEIYSECPTDFSYPPDYQIERAIGWKAPSNATSDYFNVCDPNGWVSVPLNFAGFQEAQSGNAYTGLCAIQQVVPNPENIKFYFEYIQGELIEPLKPNTFYRGIFYIVLEKSRTRNLSTRNIGMYFSDTAINNYGAWTWDPQCPCGSFDVTPQVITGFYPQDSVNWMKVEGVFKANGGEKYVTIGAFLNENNPDTIHLIDNLVYGILYIYIDNVQLYELDEIPALPNVITPNDDGFNDELDLSNYEDYEVRIFNRWGVEIFRNTTDGVKWDGTNRNGTKCADGVYFYVIEHLIFKEITMKGSITIISN